MVMRLVPSPGGCAVRTAHGVLHLPGLRLEVAPARGRSAKAVPAGSRAIASEASVGAQAGTATAPVSAPATTLTGGHDG
jgi:hypothetical protein